MKPKTVAIFTANRAEHGLLEPVKQELEAAGLSAFWAEGRQHADDLVSGMELAAMTIGGHYAIRFNKPDIAIVPCDRQEMVGVALFLFYQNFPFAQFHAGDVGSGVHDEVGRWIISRCASLHFCNSSQSAANLLKSGEEAWRIHLVGSTAFNHVELDDSTLPFEAFDLLLIHPDTFSEEQTRQDVKQALSMTRPSERLTIALGPNHDKFWNIVDDELYEWGRTNYVFGPFPRQKTDWGPGGLGFPKKFVYYPNGLARPQYLALMKHCERFITNSSSALYELPAFDITKYVPIGKRNADRKPLEKIESGAAKRIADIIAAVDINDKLLRKKFTL